MKRLHQELDTNTDAFTYTVIGDTEPLYVVDSSGNLTEKGKPIGKFRLQNKQWYLVANGSVFMAGPPNGLFGLPEFELKALTALVNQ